jgi:hypothetical protein
MSRRLYLGWSGTFRAALLFLWLGGLSPAVAADSAEKKFEALARQVYCFDTGSFLHHYSPFIVIPNAQDRLAMDKQFFLLAKETSKPQLEALLKHSDPKVRTLALAALFQNVEPQTLPDIVGLAKDPAETFLRPGDLPQTGSAGPPQPQTVGMIATAMVTLYLQVAGYYYGIDNSGNEPGFADYWQKRKDRKACASWFAVQARMSASGSRPSSSIGFPSLSEVRNGIDKLPPDERAVTLLWVREAYQYDGPGDPQLLVKDEELVGLLQKLGPDKLLLVLQRQIPTDDPDMKPDSRAPYYNFTMGFLLQHATALFRSQDAAALQQQGQRELDHFSKGEPMNSPLWWIASAQLMPDRAGAILHEGFNCFEKKQSDPDDAEVLLNVSLWKMCGDREASFLCDWFYRSEPQAMPQIYRGARLDFIDGIVKTAQPPGRKLIAHLLEDPRSASLSSESLAHFSSAIDSWLPAPLVTDQELTELTGFHGKGHGDTPKMIPGLLERLQKSIPQWNS